MSDPYKVLNISPAASDDEVKHAYRELARKYHPDNYHDNPLADLAQEKMKEINEAYDQIQKQRRGGSRSSGTSSRQSYASANEYSYDYESRRYGSSAGTDPLMQRIRMAIDSGDITKAERLLNEAPEHTAEWNFLMGVVCSRRGWMDDTKRYLETACRMDPGNEEYRNALNMFTGRGYHPTGYHGGTMAYNDVCLRLCAASVCSRMLGIPICCCF